MKTLGLDLGSNSLGWAIFDDAKDDFTDSGVLIFEEGIRREKGSDSIETPAAERRKHRMARRIVFRRKLRKYHILRVLIEQNMCPLSMAELEKWQKEGIYPVDNAVFMRWLHSSPDDNPYADRKYAAEVKVTPDVLGRALYHIAQRRGFKSSRKDMSAEENNKKSDIGKVKSDIAAISEELNMRNMTLGQYFYELNQKSEKVRTRHTGRVEHYMKEFDRIAEVQELAPELTQRIRSILFYQRPLRSQKQTIGKCALDKTHNRCPVGHPLFEEFRMLAFINTIKIVDADGTRTPLDAEQRKLAEAAFFVVKNNFEFDALAKKVFGKKNTVELNYSKEKTVASCPVSHRLNSAFGCDFKTWRAHGISKSGRPVEYTYQTVFDALMYFDDTDKLKTHFATKYGFSDDAIDTLLRTRIPDGYANYSLHTIVKILPFLQQGFGLSDAVLFSNIDEVVGTDVFEANKQEIIGACCKCIAGYREEKQRGYALGTKQPEPLKSRISNYLKTRWNVNDESLDKMFWHAEGDAYVFTDSNYLPPVKLGNIRNPLVQRALTMLRRLVNQLRATGRIDGDTQINIELARVVNNRNMRMAIETYNKERENERDAARTEIEKHKQVATDSNILKYMLWKEQDSKCMYTGKTIKIANLFSTAFDIEHTVPRSRSGDNSLANKTLCDLAYNRDVKKGKLPVECPNFERSVTINGKDYWCMESNLKATWQQNVEELERNWEKAKRTARNMPPDNPEAKAKAIQRAHVFKLKLDYWRKKLGYFTKQADDLHLGFMSRQLVDTAIMTRHAVAFLRSVYHKRKMQVQPVNGIAVAWARKHWGIQGADKKNRDCHTHHAVDAMVIAKLSIDTFNAICALYKDDGVYNEQTRERMFGKERKDNELAESIKNAAEGIVVKHLARHQEMKKTFRKHHRLPRPVRMKDGMTLRHVASFGDTVRGPLHKETNYGKIKNPNANGRESYVIRKPLVSFENQSDIEKIVDPVVRQKVREQLDAYMRADLSLSFKKAILKDFWMKAPTENSVGVPIRNVRVVASLTEPHALRKHIFASKHDYKNMYYVGSAEGSNIKLAIYFDKQKNKYSCAPMNLLGWAKEHKSKDFVPPEKQDGFIGYIIPGNLAIAYYDSPEEFETLSQKEKAKRVYKIVKFEKDGRITFVLNTEAREAVALGQYLKASSKKEAGESVLSDNPKMPHEKLRMGASYYMKHFLFEGIHFTISIDGKIEYL